MEFSASVGYLRMIMHYVHESGLNPEQIYLEVGFDPSIFKKPEARIPVDQFIAILNAIIKNSNDPNLGLHMGEYVSKFQLNILQMLMLNAPTIGDAIDKLIQYFNLLTNFITPLLSKTKDHASLTFQYNSNEYELTRHSNEGVLSAYAAALGRISEDRIKFDSVYFTHSRPEKISEHERIFKAPIFFEQPKNKIIFEVKYLTSPIFLSNKSILNTLEKLALNLQGKIFNYKPWSKQVSQLIIESLNAGGADIESAARKLAVCPRTLQHRLKIEGTTYKKLLDNIRKEKALFLLEKEDIPIGEIAFVLGYSEQSVFARAFRRWVGSTPNEYRSQFK